ncbi:unnamed protein product [Caenorhabditis auriculariae]|uniref:Peptidase S9 prolyl oligopeptidase catalytic domain-containing protein n=1 Tax=Caenorhabditis auriculariae TaxID=2777116 RepID=A0A8S1HCT4_9PELO|nr:unnamed protein product [Caenorhabditis auriculariae]
MTTRENATVAPFGSWKSRITPDLFSKGNCKAICEIQAVDDTVYWVEQSVTTGKRELFSKKKDEETLRWAEGHSVQTSVHEYGGGALRALYEGSVLFCTNDGIFQQNSPSEAPQKIADTWKMTSRYADCDVTPTHIYCVNEFFKSPEEKVPENRIISINRQTKAQTVVASGADFYAFSRVSPDEKKIVWMQWNHPNMPWDETSIHMASLNDEGGASDEVVVKDGTGKEINYMSPMWAGDENLFIVNDSSNFWNLYEVDTKTFNERNLLPMKKELGFPLWELGARRISFNSEFMAFYNGDGLYVVKEQTFKRLPIPDFTLFLNVTVSNSANVAFAIASGPARASTLIRVDLEKGFADEPCVTIIRESKPRADIEALGSISIPQELFFESDDVLVSGFFYPPASSDFVGPPGELPPVILLGHGGPTAATNGIFDLKKQFYTSRGFAVFDVNYRGSTGFGSDFRRMLRKQCGVVDRNDMINGAKFLVEQGLVDSEKITITGSSSGGFLLLSCLIHSDIFKAAVSVYGVADLVALDEDTHKFETCYNQSLVGKYPEVASVYEERNPNNHINKINTPIAFLHGTKDTVVPMAQSISLYEKLRARGVMTALMLFEGEGHGFRTSKSISESTEATYFFLATALGITPSVKSEIEIVNEKSHI